MSTSGGSREPERGAAALELAIVLPILIMLVFGIIQFGRGYNAKIELTGAVREAARAIATGGSTGDAAAIVANAAPNLNPAPTVTVLESCPAGSTGLARVRAVYDLSYDIPLVTSGTWSLTATGVMRCGL